MTLTLMLIWLALLCTNIGLLFQSRRIDLLWRAIEKHEASHDNE